MRTNANTGRRVSFANIGEKKQHQKGSSLRNYVYAPIQKIISIADIGWETAVNVPAGVPWIVTRRKSNREGPEVPSGLPAAWSNKLVEGTAQDWSIRGADKWVLSVYTQAYHRLRPGRWVGLIATGVPPQDCTGMISKLTRESLMDFHETIVDELADLLVTQHGCCAKILRQAIWDRLFIFRPRKPEPFLTIKIALG
jgi:hypothetical protein